MKSAIWIGVFCGFMVSSPLIAAELGSDNSVDASSEATAEQNRSALSQDIVIDRDIAAQRNATSEDDILVSKIAHEKSYPGGRDEDELEVQSVRDKPIRKMGGKSDTSEAPSHDDEF